MFGGADLFANVNLSGGLSASRLYPLQTGRIAPAAALSPLIEPLKPLKSLQGDVYGGTDLFKLPL